MMKKLISIIILIFLIMPVKAQSKVETHIADVLEQFRKAMVDADSIMLDKLTSPKLSYGHSGGHVDDKREFVHKIVTGQSNFVKTEVTEQTIYVNKNVAIVRHKFNAVTNDNGKPGEVHLAVMLVWQKQHGNWKLLARQAIKIQ